MGKIAAAGRIWLCRAPFGRLQSVPFVNAMMQSVLR